MKLIGATALVWGEGWRAAVEGLNGKVIDFNENFSQTYSFGYFKIFCVVEATYSENMKPMCTVSVSLPLSLLKMRPPVHRNSVVSACCVAKCQI